MATSSTSSTPRNTTDSGEETSVVNLAFYPSSSSLLESCFVLFCSSMGIIVRIMYKVIGIMGTKSEQYFKF